MSEFECSSLSNEEAINDLIWSNIQEMIVEGGNFT